MRLPKKDQKGFTLVELLIVLAILAVLAAVVIPNVTGMFGRGAEQALDTDTKTIQTAVATFYFDIHDYEATDGWNETDGDPGHYYPTANGDVGTAYTTGTATAPVAAEGIIWMGLLVNLPAATGTDFSGLATPLADEDGPYLNEFPESCAPANTMVDADPANASTQGTYIWIVGPNGQVLSIYKDSSGNYQEGFSGTYP